MRRAVDLLAQYAAYHRDERNITMHCVGVPLIVFAVGVLLARPSFGLGGMTVSPAWIAFALSCAWYLTRGELVLGLATSLAAGVLIMLAHAAAASGPLAWLGWGVGVFLVGWLIQFAGHYYEGRKPAFVDDLSSLLVGPMFVMAEALFGLGWNKRLHDEIVRRAGPTTLRDLAAVHP